MIVLLVYSASLWIKKILWTLFLAMFRLCVLVYQQVLLNNHDYFEIK